MYSTESQIGGWTRIDMLLHVYDRAIVALESVIQARQANQQSILNQRSLEFGKCMLAIHAGLKPEENEIAFNIARLIHFVQDQFCQQNFDNAREILESIRNGYAAIRDQAVELEMQGKIPALDAGARFQTHA